MGVPDIEAGVGERWNEIAERYAERLREAEEAAARWRFAPREADWENPYPLWSARQGYKPAFASTAHDAEPHDWDQAVRYGYDAAGDILIARRFTVIRGVPRANDEALWTTISGQSVFLKHYYPPLQNHLVMCAVPRHEDGRVAGVDTWYEDGRFETETYTYDGDRLVSIDEDGHTRFDIDYDDTGDLLRVTATSAEHPSGLVVFRRQISPALRNSARVAQDALLSGIEEWTLRRAPADPIRVLVIGYSEPPDDPLPPVLALGTVGDKLSAKVASGEWEPDALYAVGDQPVVDMEPAELRSDPAVLDAFQALNQEWRHTDNADAARRFLLGVAKDLNNRAWTDGFVVVPVDFQTIDLERNLRAMGVKR